LIELPGTSLARESLDLSAIFINSLAVGSERASSGNPGKEKQKKK
jgi:hypothetical protein